MVKNMTLQHCKYIVKIAECKSFNEAARELYVTQSSLSSAIKTTEEELGISIFKRNNRGIELTDDGIELLEYARRIVLQMNEIDERFNSEKNSKTRLCITTIPSSLSVNALCKIYKELDSNSFTVNILDGSTQKVISDVEAGISDIGILSVNSSNQKAIFRVFKEKGLIFHPLSETKLYMSCNSNHPLAKKNVVTLEDLMAYPNVSYYTKKEPVYEFSQMVLDEFNPPKKITVSNVSSLNAILGKTDAVKLGARAKTDGLVSVPFDNDVVYTAGYILKENVIPTDLAKKFIEALNSLKK